jgi:hypothetical protein
MSQRAGHIGVRLNDEERKQILEQARASGFTISDFVRRCILGKQIVSKADLRILAEQTRVLNELRKLGGLLKHIHVETRGAYSQDTANAIRALEVYAKEQEKSMSRKERASGDSVDSQDS